jgi:hypothetical protein
MKAAVNGVSRKELALVKKTLKRHPGCSIRMTRGADGEPKVQLIRGTDRASKLARLKAEARRADLLMLQARVQLRELELSR